MDFNTEVQVLIACRFLYLLSRSPVFLLRCIRTDNVKDTQETLIMGGLFSIMQMLCNFDVVSGTRLDFLLYQLIFLGSIRFVAALWKGLRIAFTTVPWVLALVVASLPLFDMFRLLPHLFMLILESCSFPIVVTIILAYITLWFKVKTRDATGHERSREKDKGLAVTLISSLIFPFTWLPYTIILSIINLCLKCAFSN